MLLYFKPVTPSQRHLCLVNKRFLERNLFISSLFYKKFSSFGRNHNGMICSRFRWKGHKKLYRLIDFFFLKGIPFFLESYEYDPNRSSFINLIFYKNGIYSYILSTMNTYLGSSYICSSLIFDLSKYGNRLIFMNIPVGSILHNISTSHFSKSKYVRAAGTFGILIRKDSQFAWIKLPSSKKFYKKDILLKCSLFGFGTLGRVSNMMHKNTNLGKAGRAWWLGRKSIVRGVAMNPIDHPHGGGEGKKSKKASPVNKWGTLIKFSRVFKRKKS